ncbi:MAG: pseudaminic acid synthase [Desulfovibrionales bacterium]|nr:pseudaminic acid synthase [Desulfovibrionales bacterium]
MTDGKMFAEDRPVFIVAEMSANHNQDFDRAVAIVRAAAEAGADAIKLQTYTPDTITLDCDNEHFRIKGTIWEGRTLHDLYAEAYTPWEWHPKLKQVADDLGLVFFSTPFDASAVDFLEELGTPCHKVASFELVDIPLIRRIASTGKPAIMSTGMASEAEIREAVDAFHGAGGTELALLKCTSAYPAPPEELNLRTIPYLAERFGVVAGLSDHTLGTEIPIAATALGARIIEKHFCLSRSEDGPDTSFSLVPEEFKAMVHGVRKAEKALGKVTFELTEKQKTSLAFRRSLFIARDMAPGETFTPENIRSVRPGNGLHTRHLDEILGRTAAAAYAKGTPLTWDMVR